MPDAGAASLRFLVEWYSPQLGCQATRDIARRLADSVAAVPQLAVEVQYVLTVPDDDYAFAVVAASSPELVARACQRAGLPADRISATG